MSLLKKAGAVSILVSIIEQMYCLPITKLASINVSLAIATRLYPYEILNRPV